MKILISISTTIFLFIGYFIAFLNFPSQYSWVSTIFIVLMSIPTFYYFAKDNGLKNSIKIIVILSLFAILIEGQAILTGLPYSEFSYSDKIAGKLFNIVPWTVGFAWTPLFLSAGFLAIRFSKESKINFVLLTAIFLVLFDLVLDPGATAAGLWIWSNQNGLYGVPLQNFFGWFISGFLGALIFVFLNQNFCNKLKNNFILTSTIFSLAFWTGANFFYKNYLVVILGLIIILYLIYLIIIFKNYYPKNNKPY